MEEYIYIQTNNGICDYENEETWTTDFWLLINGYVTEFVKK